MQIDKIVDLSDFSKGFYAADDTTKAPFGSFRTMRNAQVTDRGGVGPRPGTLLLGTKNTSASAIKGFYTYKRSFEENEILIKTYDDEVEAYSNTNTSAGWFRVKDGFTSSKEFGFVHSLFNTSNENYVVGSNRYEPYFRWSGAITQLNGALVGAETSLTVDSTLRADIYESKTATANSSTTLDVSTVTWAASQWNGFYVYITSGVYLGQVRLISATTSTQITFATLAGAPGNCTFEIRRLLFPATGTVIYNGTEIAYTAIPSATTITVVSAHSAPDNSVLTQAVENYPENPRGNRLTNYLGRIIVGNVRSALSRDSGGTLQGYASGGSYFVSKLNNPFNFTFTATRVAGEGDIQAVPYGGGDITDVIAQENTAYIFKRDYIEAVVYSQDVDDFAIREPLKPGTGSVGKTTQGTNDVYFITPAKEFTTIGRVKAQDLRPQTSDIGNKIKRWLQRTETANVGRGFARLGKVYVPLQATDQDSANNVLLVYNENSDSFEGIWDIGAFGLSEFAENYYYASSTDANVYKMFTDRFADVEGSTAYGYTFEVKTHYFNLTASKAYQQSLHGVVIEGYIGGGTELTYNVWKDFNDTPSITVVFSSDEDGYLDGEGSNIYLGDSPLGINNMYIDYTDVDADGRRHFSAKIYFPFLYGNYFSIGMQSSGIDQNHETTRVGLMISEDISTNTNKVKTI